MTQLPAVINQMPITKFKMIAVIGNRDIFVELDMIGEVLRKICFSKFPLNFRNFDKGPGVIYSRNIAWRLPTHYISARDASERSHARSLAFDVNLRYEAATNSTGKDHPWQSFVGSEC